jgi:dTDP-4-amino-4,6-dideoxygalactose transaminase
MTDRALIPLFDIRLTDEQVGAVADTLRSGWLTQGPRTEAFERQFADHLAVRHVVALSSCTAALHLAYLAAGVGPGDEVVVPAITFVATANAVRYCGARPVLADVVGPHDLGVDPADVERRLTDRTKAVCAVHYAGYPAALDELVALCESRGLALIEDAAHSPSATTADGSRKLGSVGLAGAFSFFSNKVLSCGEGGALATDDDDVAALARSLRSHAMTTGTWDRHRGRSATYDVTAIGFNYRMDEPRAALLAARLPALEEDIAARRRIVRRYRDALAGEPGVIVPYRDEDVEHSSCYAMPVVLEDARLRDPLRQLLIERHRVQTSVLYPAIHEFSAYASSSDAALPHSEHVARAQVTLPLYPHLAERDQERVIAAVRDALAELAESAATPATGR